MGIRLKVNGARFRWRHRPPLSLPLIQPVGRGLTVMRASEMVEVRLAEKRVRFLFTFGSTARTHAQPTVIAMPY